MNSLLVETKPHALDRHPQRIVFAALHAAWIAAFAPEFVGPWQPVRSVANRYPALETSSVVSLPSGEGEA
ncbi:MAG: hypothetical protein HYY93_05300 [Planctomycetes bacterium]|nr:hypothetical protein [Planctomycetota bacterium]